jgi:hypothetical protein
MLENVSERNARWKLANSADWVGSFRHDLEALEVRSRAGSAVFERLVPAGAVDVGDTLSVRRAPTTGSVAGIETALLGQVLDTDETGSNRSQTTCLIHP